MIEMEVYVALAYFHLIEGPLFVTCIPHNVLDDTKEFYIANKALANKGFSLFEEENITVISYGFNVYDQQLNSYHQFSLVVLLINCENSLDRILSELKSDMKKLCKALVKPILEQNLIEINTKLSEFHRNLLKILQRVKGEKQDTPEYESILAIYDTKIKFLIVLGDADNFEKMLLSNDLYVITSRNRRFFVFASNKKLQNFTNLLECLNEIEKLGLFPIRRLIVSEKYVRNKTNKNTFPERDKIANKTRHASIGHCRMFLKKQKKKLISRYNNAC